MNNKKITTNNKFLRCFILCFCSCFLCLFQDKADMEYCNL